MFSNFDADTRQLLTGNLLLILCCLFYLLWWGIAFHPTHAIKGMKSGWLLIFAFLFGVWGVVRVVNGSIIEENSKFLLHQTGIWITGLACYVALLALTTIFLHRQVTTELLLIVGWTALMFAEVNALYGLGQYGKETAILFFVALILVAVLSLFCYLLYYQLDAVKGYVDGFLPLAFAGMMMAAITISTVF